MTIIKTFETEDTKNKFSKKYIIFSLTGLLILTLIEIWVSNEAVAFGEKFEKLSILEKGLKMENQILENEIATTSAFLNVATASASLGFSIPKTVQYIK